MLMITNEHLAPSKWQTNFHKDINEYIGAKRNIIRFQTKDDFSILNRDYPASNESDTHTQGKIFLVSRERDVPTNGCFVKDDVVWVRENARDKKIIDTADILLPGKHNLENVCAASLAAYLSGVSIENIKSILASFKGLEHRLELVSTMNGVRYYDDSIATNPESAIAAIQAFKNPKILILGGVTEGSSFDELGKIIAKDKTIKAIIGIGKEWPTIRIAIEEHKPFEELLLIEGAENMQQVVSAASKIAAPEDVVLLSPACKSFDMFKNYQDRGDQFKEEVKKLKENLAQ
jgi:UDP-N-acetylmuramoylalanine--D-glutamate ligase